MPTVDEAQDRSDELGGSREEHEYFLRKAVQTHPSSDFVNQRALQPDTKHLTSTRSLPAMIGSLVLIWWLIMMIFQGEGLELDLQRRRNPDVGMAVQPSREARRSLSCRNAVADCSQSNLRNRSAFSSASYTAQSTEQTLASLAAILIGVPVSVAAACVGKALEIGIMLRFPPRSRGALIGLMSWLGYAAMVLFSFAPSMHAEDRGYPG